MADDVRLYQINTSTLSNLNNRQFAFESTNDADLGWKMAGGKNNSGEETKFLGKDKPARVTTLTATGAVSILSGSITTDSLSLSTANSFQVLYGDFSQASTFKWEGSKLRVGSTETPEYMVDIDSSSQDQLRVSNSNANALSPLFVLEKTSASPADSDGCGKIVFRGTNDDASVPEVDFAVVECFSNDISSNSPDGKLKVQTMVNGTLTDSVTIEDGGVNIKMEASQTASPLKVLDSSSNNMLEVLDNGTCFAHEGLWGVDKQYGGSLVTFNYGQESALHTNGVGSYDHTGGAYEKLFTRTSGDLFTQSDADDGNFILMKGANSGAWLEIKEFIDVNNVIVQGFGLSSDLPSQSYEIYNHPCLIVAHGSETEYSVGATGKFEVFSYNFTGECVSEIKLDSAGDDAQALKIEVNTNGYNLNEGIKVENTIGDLQPGDLSHSIHITIDESGASSADSTTDIQGIRVETTDSSSAAKCALCIGPSFDKAISISGAQPANPEYGYTVFSSTVVDRVNNTSPDGDDSFINTGTDTSLFPANNDYILIGSDNTFEIVSVNLETNSSVDMDFDFYYSKAGGGWTAFSPSDGTNGFQNAGQISFSAPGDWAKDDEAEVNGDITNAYYIKIQRTRVGPPITYPVEDYFKIFADQATGAYIDGQGVVKLAYLAAAPSSLENGMMWMESDGLHVYYGGSERLVTDGAP